MSKPNGAILVVDDEPDMVSGFRRILRLDGYQIDSAETAKGLLSRSNWSDYFAIVLDRQLPDGNADELLPKLREVAPHASVIIVTGYANMDGALAALRHGAADYLIKPVNPDALRASLARIAARNAAKEDMRQSEERFQLMVDSVQDYAIFMLDAEGHIASWNKGAERIKGYAEEEILGKHFSIFYPQQDLDDGKPERELKVAVEVGRFEEEGLRLRKDGSTFYANVVITPLWDTQRRLVGFAKVTRDITERKRAQEKQLQSERLSGIGEAMAGLVHESRNALNTTQSALQMMERRIDDDSEMMTFIEGARDAQTTIERLFEEVREYAAPVVINHRNCNLTDLVEHTWQSLDASHNGRNVQLKHFPGEANPECDACHVKLGQVFRNLLENALAACDDPVEIEVRYTDASLHGRPAICVSVADNGPGLTLDQRARMFEAFFTTKTHGTGLGMAISKRIVEAHGGTIAAGDGAGRGAQIVITLPDKKS